MDIGATISTGESTEHDCDYCGATLKITYTRQKGHNEREEYHCPECGKEYHVRASLPIGRNNIKVTNTRTDGRTNRYGEEEQKEGTN